MKTELLKTKEDLLVRMLDLDSKYQQDFRATTGSLPRGEEMRPAIHACMAPDRIQHCEWFVGCEAELIKAFRLKLEQDWSFNLGLGDFLNLLRGGVQHLSLEDFFAELEPLFSSTENLRFLGPLGEVCMEAATLFPEEVPRDGHGAAGEVVRAFYAENRPESFT